MATIIKRRLTHAEYLTREANKEKSKPRKTRTPKVKRLTRSEWLSMEAKKKKKKTRKRTTRRTTRKPVRRTEGTASSLWNMLGNVGENTYKKKGGQKRWGGLTL